MNPAAPRSGERHPRDFALGEWTVQPSLNRLAAEGRLLKVEPKQMDVMVALASRAGEVVSKEELANAVWPDVFVTESVITRAIVGLRRALGDDAKNPRFIETIAKRGYRLLLSPAAIPSATGAPELESRARPALGVERSTTSVRSNPYSVGQWVRGQKFHGRADLLHELLVGERQAIWLLGSRAVGKTSTLRQLEHLAGERPELQYFPLYWDLQGSGDPDRLAHDFSDVLTEIAVRFEAIGVHVDALDGGDFFSRLTRVRRLLQARGQTLLLLLDEAEELLVLQDQAPALIRKLRRALQSQTGLRTVMAASSRLWRLNDAPSDTSPFLHGFAPPYYLGALGAEEARRLVCHPGGTDGGRGFDEGAITEILRLAGGHPYLLQLLSASFWKQGDLERTIREAAVDASLDAFFAIDFGLLAEPDREFLQELAERDGSATPGPVREMEVEATLARSLHLERLGMVRRNGSGQLEIASPIFAGWLRERRQNE